MKVSQFFALIFVISSTALPTETQNVQPITLDCTLSQFTTLDSNIEQPLTQHIIDCEMPKIGTNETELEITFADFGDPVEQRKFSELDQVEKTLRISGSQATFIPYGIFETFKKVTTFTMSNTQARSITRRHLNGLVILADLSLENNKIESLPVDTFYGNPELREIDVGRNNIKELHEDLLIHNPHLSDFNAYENDIEVLPAGFFRNNPELAVVNMNSNKFKDIQVDFRNFQNIIFIDFKTYEPYTFDGTCNVDQLNRDTQQDELMEQFMTNIEEKCRQGS